MPDNTVQFEKRPPLEKVINWSTNKVYFAIVDLMVATLLCGATLVIAQNASIIGTVSLFIATVIGCNVIYFQGRLSTARCRFWFQFLWGILIPVTCICTDPFVFGSFVAGPGRSMHIYAVGCYAFMAWQMLILIANWVFGQTSSIWNVFFATTFFIGAFFSFAIGIVLIPATLIGLIVVIGLLGLTPLITGYIFVDLAIVHYSRCRIRERWFVSLMMIFFASFLAFGIPVAANIAAVVNLDESLFISP